MNRLHRLTRISSPQLLALSQVSVLSILALPIFWLLPSSFWVRQLTRAHDLQEEPRADDAPQPEDYIWAINALARRWHWGVSCVFWSWIGMFWLRRCGETPAVKVGVKAKYPSIAAHAWLLWQGRVIVGDRDDLAQYRILY